MFFAARLFIFFISDIISIYFTIHNSAHIHYMLYIYIWAMEGESHISNEYDTSNEKCNMLLSTTV